MPKRSSHRRTTRIGPPTARRVQMTATDASQKRDASRPNRRLEATLATCPIAQNSTAVHPTSWSRLRAEGRKEPRSPRTGRNSTIDGTTSRSPARPTERSPHRTARSRPDRRRRSAGTGRMPQDGASRSRARSRRSLSRDMVRVESTHEAWLRLAAKHPLQVRERAAHQPADEWPIREQDQLAEDRNGQGRLLGPGEPGSVFGRLEEPFPDPPNQAPVGHHQPSRGIPHRDLQMIREQRYAKHPSAHGDDHADALATRRQHPHGDGVPHPRDLVLPGQQAAPRVSGIDSSSASATTTGSAAMANAGPYCNRSADTPATSGPSTNPRSPTNRNAATALRCVSSVVRSESIAAWGTPE